MTVTRSDRVQQFRDGQVISDQAVSTDVTVEAVVFDLAAKGRAAIATNITFLALSSPTNAQTLAQVQRLTRESTAIIRLLLGLVADSPDLLTDTTGT